MAIDTFKVYTYKCDYYGCDSEHSVEDRGGSTGQQPEGIFTGTVLLTTNKGFCRVNWVACTFEHISGAVERMVKEGLGN